MKLYIDANHISPYAMFAFVALREKGLEFESVPVDLKRKQHLDAGYAEVSTTLRVPTLSDEGFNLSESSAICEYLEDRHPGTLIYPPSVQQKAKVRELQAWLRSDLMPMREERPTEVIFLRRPTAPLTPAAQASARKLVAAAEALLPEGRQSLFAQWTIADTELALMLMRLVLAGDPLPERLKTFAVAQWQRPSVQEWVNMPRPDAQ